MFRRCLLLLASALFIGLFAAPNALAATSYLQPDSDTHGAAQGSTWITGPTAGQSFWSVLEESQVRPYSPSGGSDYISSTGNTGDLAAEVGVGTTALSPGDQVTLARAHAYVNPGTNRNVTIQLRTGTTVLATATATNASGTSWHQLDYTGGLTQAQLDDLRIRFIAGSGTTNPLAVYAAYVEAEVVPAPGVPTISGAPLSPGTLSNPQWMWTSDPAAISDECRLERDGAEVYGWAPCVSPVTHDISAMPDGTYEFQVRSKNAINVAGPIAESTYVVDRTKPDPPTLTATPAATDNDLNPSWSFTAEAGATVECELMKGGTTISGWSACSGTKSYALGSETSGTFTFSVRARDALNNQGDATTFAYTLDRDAPATSITGGPNGPTNDPTPTFTFTSEAGATFACRVERAGVQVIAPFACASGETPDLTGFSDGAFTFFVTATDAVGNPGTELSRGFTLDTAKPAAPVVTGPTGETNGATPSWSFTGEAGAAYECRVDRDAGATVVSDWAPCVSPRSYSLAFPQPDGAYTFHVRAVDAALNVSDEGTRTITLDRVAAADPVITTTPPDPSNDDTPVWSFTSDAGTTTECRIQKGGTDVLAWTACTAPYTADLTAQTDGAFSFSVRSVDAAGNRSTGVSSAYTLDEDKPAPPAIIASPATADNDKTPSWSFTTDAGTTTSCQVERGAAVVTAWTSCASPYTQDLTAPGTDGTYTFRVKAHDPATNESTVASHTFTLDTVGPSVPSITGAPAASSNDVTPTWTWTADAGTGARCRVEREGTTVIASTPCASGYTPDLSGFSDGAFTLYVRSLDDAQNPSLDATSGYTLDRGRPAAPAVTGPSGPTKDPNPSWSFTAEAGATFQCQVDRDAGATVVSAWAPCVSPRPYNLTVGPDATYTFRVKAYDAAGNEGFEGTRTITLDRGVPLAPAITAGPSAPSQNASPSYTFTTEPGSSPECRMERGGTTIQGWEACASPWSYALTTDGTHTFTVRTTDAAGNTSLESSRTYDLDRQAPNAPTVTSGPNGPTNDNTPTWAFTSESGTTECQIERGATIVISWTSCASGYTPTLSVDGAHTLKLRTTDAAGNVSSPVTTRTFDLDRALPVAPTITGGPTGESADPGPSYSFTYESGATAYCQMERGGTVVHAFEPCASPKSYALGPTDGTYTFSVRAVDPAGNQGAIATRTYTLDRQAPNAPTITAKPAANTNNPAISYAFNAATATTFNCQLERGATVVRAYGTCTSPFTYSLSGQPDGVYTFRVRASDLAANESTETNDTFALDRVAPNSPTITSGPSGATTNSNPTYAFTAEGGAALECQVDRDGGATVVYAYAPCTSPRTYDLSLQPEGAYTFRVRATDAAGNTSNPPGTRTYTIDRTPPPAPTVTSGPPADSNDDTPLWAFTGEPGATFTCRVTRGATEVMAPAPCTSPQGYSLNGLPDGTYTFRVKAIDAAGLESLTEGTSTYTLDTNPPSAATITGGPSGPTNGPTPSWTFTSDPGTTTTCSIARGATVISSGACSGTASYNLGAQPDGTYTFRIETRDAANNQGPDATRSIELDRSAPVAPMITGWPGGQSSDAQPAVTFSHESGATARCQIERDGTIVQAYTACSSPATYDFRNDPDGVYTFSVRAYDPAGNPGAVTSGTYTLDRVAPTAPVIGTKPPAATNSLTATFGFSAATAVSYRCQLERSGTIISPFATCASPRSFDLTGQPETVFTFRVRAYDAANNQSEETTDSFALDRTAPPAPTVTTGPNGPTKDPNPAFGFTSEGGSATQCRIERGSTVVEDWAACVTGRSYDLGLQPDGSYTFRVRATDAAGNTGNEGTRAFTLDRVLPAAPAVTAGPTGPSQDDAPAFGFTAEVGASTECRIMRGTTTAIGWAPCSTPQGFNLTGHPDGVYTFEVEATDPAGNRGPAGTRTYTLDRTKPLAPTIDSGPTVDSKDATPTWAFTGEAGSTASCRVERGTTVVRGWAPCASPHTPDLTGEVDGTYTFSVRVYDPANNEGAIASSTYRLDRVAPVPPALTAGPTGPSQDQLPSFAFTAETGAALRCQLDRDGGTLVDADAPCVSPKPYDLTLQPDGVYTFRVTATDAALNVSDTGTRTYTLDRTEPAPPTVTGGPSGFSRVDQPSWSFVAEPGSITECRIVRGGTEVVGWAQCTSPQGFDLRGEADGTYTLEIEAIDAAGNRGDAGTRSYTLDRDNPDAPTIDAGPPADSPDATPTYAFTGEPGAPTECRVERGATTVVNWTACTSPYTPNLTAQPDGTFTFRVRSIDAAGNVGDDAGRSYTLDRDNPDAPMFTSGPSDPSKDTTPTWSWMAENGASPECRVMRGTTVVSPWAACASPHTHDLAGEPDGTYELVVRVNDAAGNNGDEASRGFRLDTDPPAVPTVDSAPGTPTADGTPEWTFSGEAGARFECSLTRGGTTVEGWAACASPKVYDLGGGAPDGNYTFHVRATDAADNTGAPASSTIDVDRTQPTGVTIGTGPGADGNDKTPTWTFTGDGTGGFRCWLVSSDGTEVYGDAPCVSPLTYNLGLHPDDTYTLNVQSISTSGTRGPVLTYDYKLDTAPPAPASIDSGPPALTFDDTPTWSFSGEIGARFECRIDRAGTAVRGWAACSTPETFDLSSEPNGNYDLSVRVIDPAGNVSDPATASYELDRTPPPTPTFTSEPPSRSSGRAPQWGFTGTGARFECRLERGATELMAWTTCVSPRRIDLTGEPDGVYTFSVRAISPAGVPSTPATDTYDLDSGAPEPPTLTATPGPLGNGSRPSWAFTTEPGAALACRLERDNGVVVVDWAACGSPKDYDLGGEPDGNYLFSVRATDVAGNVGGVTTHQHRVDRLPPEPPTVSSAPPPVSSTRAPIWSFRAEDGAGIECRLEGPAGVVSDWGPCTSPKTFDLNNQPDGAYTLLLRATDPAGNRGGETRSAFTLDATAPGLKIDSGPGPLGRDRNVAWTFSGDADAGFECRLVREAAEVVGWAPCASPGRYDLNGKPDGLYRFWLRARDAAGNPGQQVDAAYELDTTPPRDPEITDRPTTPGDDRTPTWRFTGEDEARFDCKVDRGGAAVLEWAPCRSPFTADLERSDDGEYRFSVRATDRAGNTGGATASKYVLEKKKADPAPTPPAKPEEPVGGDGDGDDVDGGAGTTRRAPADRLDASKPARKKLGKLSTTPPVGGMRRKDRANSRPERPAQAPERAAESKNPVSRALGAAVDAARAAADVVTKHPDKSVFPGGLLLLVLGFLAVQGRLDRNDPKLALAPDFADPDLEFGPPPGIEP